MGLSARARSFDDRTLSLLLRPTARPCLPFSRKLAEVLGAALRGYGTALVTQEAGDILV